MLLFSAQLRKCCFYMCVNVCISAFAVASNLWTSWPFLTCLEAKMSQIDYLPQNLIKPGSCSWSADRKCCGMSSSLLDNSEQQESCADYPHLRKKLLLEAVPFEPHMYPSMRGRARGHPASLSPSPSHFPTSPLWQGGLQLNVMTKAKIYCAVC